jgi:nucleotide-binding universal stress UspA family protein
LSCRQVYTVFIRGEESFSDKLLDGSRRAEAILSHVEEMAQCFGAKVIFIQVIEPYSVVADAYGAMAPNVDAFEQQTSEADVYLGALRGEFREKGIEAREVVEHGPIVETIIDVAEREGADLIAMASHGRSGLSRVFYGSVAAGILQRVDRPLLLIRSQ